jgi:cell wall-associated NlpC family hydrolase
MLSQYIGIPYVFHGEDRYGVDCLGLIKLYYKEQFGITLPDYFYIHGSAKDSCHLTIEVGEADGNWLPVDEIELGDVLIFRVGRYPSHVGMALGDGDFLHCLEGRQSCIEKIENWTERLLKAYRWNK